MKTVYVRGNNKEDAILKALRCSSFAQAVNRYNLGNSDNAWEALEKLAVGEVSNRRTSAKLSRIFRSIEKAVQS